MGEWNFGRGKGTTNKVKYTLQCEWCSVSFPAKRPDRQTCSGKCRSALSRWARMYHERFGCWPFHGPRGSSAEQNKHTVTKQTRTITFGY